MSIGPTVTVDQAAATQWDALVIGGGPAGSVAARQLALHGLCTLLVDRKSFPRRKVCGGYLSSRSLAVLQLLGLQSALASIAAVPLNRFCVYNGKQSATLPLPVGLGITRAELDTELVRAAVDAGAQLLIGTAATVGEPTPDGTARHVRLAGAGAVHTLTTRLVVVADGLGHPSLHERHEFAERVRRGSRVGLGAIVETAPRGFAPGTIFMAVAKPGYVGLVRLDDHRLNVAAAVDPGLLRRHRQPGLAIREILQEAGLPMPSGLLAADWRGTGSLTRRTPRPAGHRLLIVGDAAGYIEPFTGEGMAWALTGAAAMPSVLPPSLQRWDRRFERRWMQLHKQLVGRRQFWCRALARLVRSPRGVQLALWLSRRLPAATGLIVGRLDRLPPLLPRRLAASRLLYRQRRPEAAVA